MWLSTSVGTRRRHASLSVASEQFTAAVTLLYTSSATAKKVKYFAIRRKESEALTYRGINEINS